MEILELTDTLSQGQLFARGFTILRKNKSQYICAHLLRESMTTQKRTIQVPFFYEWISVPHVILNMGCAGTIPVGLFCNKRKEMQRSNQYGKSTYAMSSWWTIDFCELIHMSLLPLVLRPRVVAKRKHMKVIVQMHQLHSGVTNNRHQLFNFPYLQIQCAP